MRATCSAMTLPLFQSAGDAGRTVQEVLEHALTVRGVLDLGVPLHAVEPALVAGERGDRGRVARGEHLEALRRADHRVAVAHPRDLLGRLIGEQLRRRRPARRTSRRAVLARPGLRDLAAELARHHLEAVADAERRERRARGCRGRDPGPPPRRRSTGRRSARCPTGFLAAISSAVTVCGTISL